MAMSPQGDHHHGDEPPRQVLRLRSTQVFQVPLAELLVGFRLLLLGEKHLVQTIHRSSRQLVELLVAAKQLV
jgi:hypothetical protein